MLSQSRNKGRGMEGQVDETIDIMRKLDEDMVLHILTCLDSDVDIARATAVSRSWRRLVIEGSLWKHLCLSRFPELEVFEEVAGPSSVIDSSAASSSHSTYLEREHRVYSDLYYGLTKSSAKRSCIFEALGASSTDNSPEENIVQTLHPRARYEQMPSYWSSKGQKDETVPETLTYRLLTPLCVVDEIKIKPFEAYFQYGRPIYSSKFVRFKLGYSYSQAASKEQGTSSCTSTTSEEQSTKSGTSTTSTGSSTSQDYVWKYVSPLYPMEQVDSLQSFPLPRPVLCIGGIIQVELIGRVQTQRTDELYYICICHVDVQGRLVPSFDFEIKDGKKFILKHLNGAPVQDVPPETTATTVVEDEADVPTVWYSFAERIRHLRTDLRRNQVLLNMLGHFAVANLLFDEEGGVRSEDDEAEGPEHTDDGPQYAEVS